MLLGSCPIDDSVKLGWKPFDAQNPSIGPTKCATNDMEPPQPRSNLGRPELADGGARRALAGRVARAQPLEPLGAERLERDDGERRGNGDIGAGPNARVAVDDDR